MKRLPLVCLSFWALIVGVGCTSDDLSPPIDCDVEGPAIQVSSADDSECNQQNGFVEVAATGGMGNYQYSINGGAMQSSPRFENLAAGSYTILVSDENGCTSSLSHSVNNKEGVNLTLQSAEAGCGGAAGSIVATPDGGEAPYTYSINGGTFQNSAEFTNLAAGEYVVSIKDETGCESSQAIRVNTGISFAASIQPIITSSCAINDCHNGNQFPDFRVFKNIHDNAANIKKLTGDRTMPDEGSLTQQQINEIGCWVDDGALEN